MSDTVTATVADAPSVATDRGTKYIVPIKGKQTMEVWSGDLPDVTCRQAFLLGLQSLLSRGGVAKISVAGLEGEALEKAQTAIMASAMANLEKMKKGDIRATAGIKTKTAGVVKTEAMRIARTYVKAELKRQNVKISSVPAKDITRWAGELLGNEEYGPAIMKQAEESIAAQAAKAEAGIKITANIAGLEKVAPRKPPKRGAEKEKAPLSATQAGRPAQRPQARPQGAPSQARH